MCSSDLIPVLSSGAEISKTDEASLAQLGSIADGEEFVEETIYLRKEIPTWLTGRSGPSRYIAATKVFLNKPY